jgi:hypothetical protein
MSKQAKSTLLSVLRIVTEIAWYAAFVALGILVIVIIANSFILPVEKLFQASSEGNGEFTIDADFLSVTFNNIDIGHNRLFMAGILGVMAVGLAVVIVIMSQLRKIFASLAQGTPFTPENVKRIKSIGYVVITGVFLKALVGLAAGLIIKTSLAVPAIQFGFNFSGLSGGVFLGLVILVLGEVFRKGSELQEDRDLTV